jgi:hypothetical protein
MKQNAKAALPGKKGRISGAPGFAFGRIRRSFTVSGLIDTLCMISS